MSKSPKPPAPTTTLVPLRESEPQGVARPSDRGRAERRFNLNLNIEVQVKPHLILSAITALLVALRYAGMI